MIKIKNISGLYIHVPFCKAKCAYCDFYSIALTSSSPDGLLNSQLEIDAWLDALELEAKLWRDAAGGKLKIKTLYIGGGTPSILSLSAWQRLIKIILSLCDLNNLREASVEANPSSLILNKDLIKFWRENFITRVSLGVQSLNNNELKILGRVHDASMALKALDLIINANFNASADLIFALPKQDLRSWHNSLKLIINSGVRHISAYQLTLEPHTPLGKIYKDADLPDGYKFYRYAQWLLNHKNFAQYEISNFALKGSECQHNILYWRQENVLALGPAASGYIDGLRYKNPENLASYYKILRENLYFNNILACAENLDLKDRAVECAVLNLRTREGISKQEFVLKFGIELFNKVKNVLLSLPENLFIINKDKIALSAAGMRVGNAIWAELMDL